MISWLIIGILIVCGLLLIKFRHFQHRFLLIGLILLAIFFYTTVSIVKENNNLNLSTTEGFFGAIKVYFVWLGNGFHNVKDIAGYAVKMDWTNTTSTNSTNLNLTNSSK